MADLRNRLERWDDLTVVHRDDAISIDGHGFTAIARLELLQAPAAALCGSRGRNALRDPRRASSAWMTTTSLLEAMAFIAACADQFAPHFEAASRLLSNKHVWCGTDRVFDTLSLIFREFDGGFYRRARMRFSPRASTFLVECDVGTWNRAGFSSTMNDEESRAYCARVFARDLQGQSTDVEQVQRGQASLCRRTRWSHRNAVAVGDALRSVHFSIGSGTRLALEDAIALHRAINRQAPSAGRSTRSKRLAGRSSKRSSRPQGAAPSGMNAFMSA